ncbi:MAG: PEGA domain-containing protein [Planctomycetota bacterium]|jgi:hypothetical protein
MIKTLRTFLFLVLAAIIFVSAGCVTRTITVETNPSNALVYIDDRLVGESPVTIPFTYYGTRKIMIEKRDDDEKLTHERTTAFEKIKAPVYEIFPLDFVSELVWPRELKDEHILTYDLVELEPLTTKERQKKVLTNADELRQRVNSPEF